MVCEGMRGGERECVNKMEGKKMCCCCCFLAGSKMGRERRGFGVGE